MICLRTAGCPSAERNRLTKPTGGASPVSIPVGTESPFAQPCHKGRAVLLKRRRKERDDFLGREGKLSQSPCRKARRQTLYTCLVQSARGVDASFWNESLAPVSRASSAMCCKKTESFSPRPRCALLTFEIKYRFGITQIIKTLTFEPHCPTPSYESSVRITSFIA